MKNQYLKSHALVIFGMFIAGVEDNKKSPKFGAVLCLIDTYKIVFKRWMTCSHCAISATSAIRTWFSPGLPCAVSRDK